MPESNSKLPPFCWQPKAALKLIRDKSTEPSSALLVYVALTEIASDLRAEQFIASQDHIAKLCGLSVRTIFDRLHDLQKLGLINVQTPKMKAKSSYTLLRSATIAERSATIAERSATIAELESQGVRGGDSLQPQQNNVRQPLQNVRQPLPTLEEKKKSTMYKGNHSPRNPELFHKLKARINALYERPTDHLWSYAEESLLSELTTRPKIEAELGLIESFAAKTPEYLCNDVVGLLERWNPTLDHARKSGVRNRHHVTVRVQPGRPIPPECAQ